MVTVRKRIRLVTLPLAVLLALTLAGCEGDGAVNSWNGDPMPPSQITPAPCFPPNCSNPPPY